MKTKLLARLLAVSLIVTACPDGGTYSGEILLDSVGANVPWKHWSIIHSTVGGTIAEPWCK